MRCKIPEISWHNRDPVLSVDIQPKSGVSTGSTAYRLASGGTDSHVLIWYLSLVADGSDIVLDLAADLTRHQRAVNVVKWSPNGELLASGDDESVIFIWKQKADSDPLNILDSTNDQDKEVWITLKVLRGHMEDVYDLSWAPNSQFLVSGSVDNSAMIWDVNKGKSMAILSDHKGFVQGVAWDPKNQYIATLSTDRYLRIFDIQTKRVLHRVNKGVLPVPTDHELHGRRMRLFHDDTLQTFFRRCAFTPDGKLLLTPAGITDYDGVQRPLHTTYAFSRHALRTPALVLPCPDQYTVAVRCCPLLYRLREYDATVNPPVVPLPYRMIFAVATRSSVYLYDTQQLQPFALIANIHYTRLTDVTWSSDGRIVVVSSTDGFCSLITFESGELGEEYEASAAVLGANEPAPTAGKKNKKQRENDTQTPKTSRKPSTDESAISAAKAENSPSRTPLLKKINEEGMAASSVLPTKATPIAIKRKTVKITSVAATTALVIKPKEAAITKDKEDLSSTAAASTQEEEKAPEQQAEVELLKADGVSTGPKPPLPVEIIIDKEILSSDEKFESPEKKSRPATPIMVRRHPRTPSSVAVMTPSHVTPTTNSAITPSTSATAMDQQNDAKSPLSSLKHTKMDMTITPRQSKQRATPIAVRRTPRALIHTPSIVDAPTLLDEAMDAWPLPSDEVSAERSLSPFKSSADVKPPIKSLTSSETTSDRTEDIRLVYEDTVEETPPLPLANTGHTVVESSGEKIDTNSNELKQSVDIPASAAIITPKQKPQTPLTKTPRRVALKTISTPRSKKKLLE